VSRLEIDELGKEKRTDHYVEHVFVLVHLSHDKAWGASNIGAPFTQHPILLHSEGIHAVIMVKAIGVYHRPEQWEYTCDTRALVIKHTLQMLHVTHTHDQRHSAHAEGRASGSTETSGHSAHGHLHPKLTLVYH